MSPECSVVLGESLSVRSVKLTFKLASSQGSQHEPNRVAQQALPNLQKNSSL